MKIAMIGLGKMGGNMALRLVVGGHHVMAYDLDNQVARSLATESSNITACENMWDVVNALPTPRAIWLMVPHQHVDSTIQSLQNSGLQPGDLIIDGGNSNYKLSQRRGEELGKQGIHFADCGTSGGVWGLEKGYSLMIGGSEQAIAIVEPALKTLAPAPDQGWGHVGPAGAGHYVKMIHNGIEYGMMQAFAEGFELIENRKDLALDPGQISHIWQHGSVVRSWLLDLIADALDKDAALSSLSDYVDDSGEGRWTVQESIEQAVPAPVLTLALQMRFRSRQQQSYAGKLLNAMRAGFGGHAIKPVDDGK